MSVMIVCMNIVNTKLSELLRTLNVEMTDFETPPNASLGDVAISCFDLAKTGSPVDAAKELAQKITDIHSELIVSAVSAGPYVNITLDGVRVAHFVMGEITSSFGTHTFGGNKKVLVEYGCPNPLKAFHLGHLKNLITGESVARVLENAGYHVMRVNYQGDVGMHVAKALWGIFDLKDDFDAIAHASLKERAEFLGRAYAHGATAYEQSDEKKEEVTAYNDKVYSQDSSILEVYRTARQWSLDYFDDIYNRLGVRYDKMFFESEMFERGLEIVKEFTIKGIFKESEGAVIYPGSEHGLHDRVFINSKGFPTYEAKDVALAEQHLKEKPEKIIHVVGKEQTEYFKVVFRALEDVLPDTKGKEIHLPGGFLQLKGGQKMSSRKGDVITGDQLIDMVNARIGEIMDVSTVLNSGHVRENITMAALKYAMLKAGATRDVSFDVEESVSTSGDSGPYLLYVIARAKGILGKIKVSSQALIPEHIETQEKFLLLALSQYAAVTKQAAEEMDPSVIARYLFLLAQRFNAFYDACPVAKATPAERAFRMALIGAVLQVMEHGLSLLSIQTVEHM